MQSKKQPTTRAKSMATKVKRRKPSADRWINGKFQNEIRRESRSLGLTPSEYMRLLVALSKSLRQGLLKDKTIDAKAFLQLAESPLFGAMIQYVADSANKMAVDGADATTKPEPHQADRPPGQSAEGAPRPDGMPGAPRPTPHSPSQSGPPNAAPGWGGAPDWYWDAW